MQLAIVRAFSDADKTHYELDKYALPLRGVACRRVCVPYPYRCRCRNAKMRIVEQAKCRPEDLNMLLSSYDNQRVMHVWMRAHLASGRPIPQRVAQMQESMRKNPPVLPRELRFRMKR